MKRSKLHEEIAVEFSYLERTISDVTELLRTLQLKKPTVIERSAAAMFLSQFYNGLENILKRICKIEQIPLPKGAE